MKIYANTNYSEFEQFLNSDIWVLANIQRRRPNISGYTVTQYINVLQIDKNYGTIVFLEIDAEILQDYIEFNRPLFDSERDYTETALMLSKHKEQIIEDDITIQDFCDNFPLVVEFCKLEDIKLYYPLDVRTSDEIQDMLDQCEREVYNEGIDSEDI